jgi:hypothetical protein
VVIVAVPCALLGRKIEQKRRQRQAVEAIKMVGFVQYDYELRSWSLSETEKKPPTGSSWLRALLGENFFCEVDQVFIGGRKNKGDILLFRPEK